MNIYKQRKLETRYLLMRCKLLSITVEEISLQTLGTRRNRQFDCSQISR